MKHKLTILFYLLLVTQFAFANDGAFYASFVKGRNLIPMFETDISVKKEILNIKRINSNSAEIDVYYEFYNPVDEKTIEVGFEAPCPDASYFKKKVSSHPLMKNFKVVFNNNQLPYSVTIVSDAIYYKDGKFIDKSKLWIKSKAENDTLDYKYVYHFKAKFKKGINILKHKYIINLSSSYDALYSLQYILTAATRWANNQIDDFTLNIDMGNFQEFIISKDFFDNSKEWKINGVGKVLDSFDTTSDWYYWSIKPVLFVLQNGSVTFHKTNFNPKGEIFICSELYRFHQSDSLGTVIEELPFAIENLRRITDTTLFGFSKKILRNLPYARRGYVFKNPELKSFYEKQRWYMPDVDYVANLTTLTKEEQDWLKKIDK